MAIAKRIFLFVAVNVLIVATISIVLNILGVQPYLTQRGIDYGQLAMFCLVWGFGGAFISLGLSRIMAKWMMGVQVIDPNTRDPELAWVVQTVHSAARAAKLPKMPEVGIYPSPEVNAFATGPSRSRALVAVSEGLLHRMNKDQVEGVIAHEVAHIANGDMVTMTLIQGVVNAFVMFLARIAAFAISQSVKEESRHTVQMLVTFALEIALGILGMIVVAYFSRAREFRADRGGAMIAGSDKMTSALEALRREVQRMAPEQNASIAALKISSRPSGFAALFSTHPPLEERIARLQMY